MVGVVVLLLLLLLLLVDDGEGAEGMLRYRWPRKGHRSKQLQPPHALDEEDGDWGSRRRPMKSHG